MAPPPNFQLFSSLRYDPQLTSLDTNIERWDASPSPGSPFYMLPYHRDRILQAAEHFGWTIAADRIRGPEGFAYLVDKLTKSISVHSTTPFRIRALLGYDGTVTIELTPTTDVSRWNLFPARIPPPKGEGEPKVSPLTGGAMATGEGDSVYGDPPTGHPWEVVLDPKRTAPTPFTSYKTTSRDMYVNARERVGIKDFAEKREVLIISQKDGAIMEGSLTSVFFWRDGRWATPPAESGGNVGTTRRWALEKGFGVERVVKVDSLVDGEYCWISNGIRGFQLGKIKL